MIPTDKTGTCADRSAHVVRMRELRQQLGLSPSHLYALIQQGRFPKPFPLVPGGRAVGWRYATIADWVAQRERDADRRSVVA